MTALIHTKEEDVQDRLKNLGLEKQLLVDAVRQGHFAYINCTPNHPPLIPGILAWGETVRALREALVPDGWTRSNDNNYSLVIAPAGNIAIAVATGDEQTGVERGVPSNKARKGRNTRDAVDVNQISFDFGPASAVPDTAAEEEENRATWILLIHRDATEVRCELSLPASITDGHIDSWKERIILGAFSTEDEPIEIPDQPSQPDITIDIKRRA